MGCLRGVSGTGEVKIEGVCAGGGGGEVKRRGWMRYTKNRIWRRPLAGYCTYMVDDAFVALNYQCRGLLQISQGDLTQTARKPRAVFSYYCLFGCSICIYLKEVYADNWDISLFFCT